MFGNTKHTSDLLEAERSPRLKRQKVSDRLLFPLSDEIHY